MVNTRSWVRGFAVAVLTFGCSSLYAQADNSKDLGGVIVRVPDGVRSRCVNASSDLIWLTLRRVVTEQREGWFTADKSVAFFINASIKTSPSSAKPISFPLASEASLVDDGKGQVSVPIESTVVDRFPPQQPNNVAVSSLGLDLTLVNLKSKTPVGTTLQVLMEITKKMPIPNTPLAQAGSYLLDFANGAVNKEVEARDPKDLAKSATLSMNFSPDGNCNSDGASDFETTGAKVFLLSAGRSGPGYVPISKTNDYCWKADFKPSFVLLASQLPQGASCGDAAMAAAKWQQVSNDYTGFVLSAVKAPKVLGATDAQDVADAKRRCDLNGIANENCLK